MKSCATRDGECVQRIAEMTGPPVGGGLEQSGVLRKCRPVQPTGTANTAGYNYPYMMP